jgi:hypothetical protein
LEIGRNEANGHILKIFGFGLFRRVTFFFKCSFFFECSFFGRSLAFFFALLGCDRHSSSYHLH